VTRYVRDRDGLAVVYPRDYVPAWLAVVWLLAFALVAYGAHLVACTREVRREQQRTAMVAAIYGQLLDSLHHAVILHLRADSVHEAEHARGVDVIERQAIDLERRTAQLVADQRARQGQP
jgi:hypothetical protein